MGWIGDLILNVAYAGAILMAAVWVGGFVKSYIVGYSREYEDIDEMLFTFLGSIARYALLIFAGIFILRVLAFRRRVWWLLLVLRGWRLGWRCRARWRIWRRV